MLGSNHVSVRHRAGSGLGDGTEGGASDDLLQEPRAVYELGDFDTGLDAHALQHVEEVLRCHHAGRASGAAVGASAYPADSAIEHEGIVRRQRPHGGVGGRQGHTPCVVKVEVEATNVRPPLLDGKKLLLDAMRKAPRHRVEETHARDRDTRLVPSPVTAFEDVHALIQRKLANEVGTPRRRDSYLGLGNAASLSILDNRLPACELLRLRPVEVAAGEHVAEVGVEERTVFLDGQGRRELSGALVRPLRLTRRAV